MTATALAHAPVAHLAARRLVLPAEAAGLCLIAVLFVLDFAVSLATGVAIDVLSFVPNLAVGLIMLAVGALYRAYGREPGISLALFACAILILFSNACATLNILFIIPGRATIDPVLAGIDAWLGFDWETVVVATSRYPVLIKILEVTYVTSLAQMAGVVILLGLKREQQDLHRFLACGIIASIISVVIWTCMPSVGPAAWVALDGETAARLGMVMGSENTTALRDLLQNGGGTVRANELLGLIAFPSMHTVMFCLAVWYTRPTRAWPFFVAINLPMLPAIVIRGSHNLVDILGGIAVFALSAHLAKSFISKLPEAFAAAEIDAPRATSLA